MTMNLSDAHKQERTPAVERIVFIQTELGLHARPAAKLAGTAQRFESRIILEYEGLTADAKSILDILSLSAGRGASINLRCSGQDALEAAEAIAGIFSSPEKEPGL